MIANKWLALLTTSLRVSLEIVCCAGVWRSTWGHVKTYGKCYKRLFHTIRNAAHLRADCGELPTSTMGIFCACAMSSLTTIQLTRETFPCLLSLFYMDVNLTDAAGVFYRRQRHSTDDRKRQYSTSSRAPSALE